MIKLIIGSKGHGKTKQLIEMVNAAVKSTSGNVVCVEQGMQLTLELDHDVRLIDAEEYKIKGYNAFYGFVAGILAGNYDIKDIFIDGILKIGAADGSNAVEGLGDLLTKIENLKPDANIVFTVSADEQTLPESVKKFL